MDFATPSVLLIERLERLECHERALEARAPCFGFEDREYLQRTPEKGLITKQEARALSLAKLRLAPDAVVWDIGAGSGSVGLECARLAPLGHVFAIEKNAEDAANAGVSGFIVPDVPLEESGPLREALSKHGLDLIPLVGLNTSAAAGYDCGACGFETCSAFVKGRTMTDKPMGYSGPHCVMRMMDIGAALVSAAKPASLLNLDNRVQQRVGAAARALGYIKADDRISNCEFGADGYVYMTSNTRLIRAKVKVKKIARKGA